MSTPPRRIHSPEFKCEAVALARDIGVTKASRQLDITQSLIYEWRKVYEAPFSPTGTDGKSPDELVAYAKQLEEQLRVAKMERDILKKATAFFAKEQS
jgi:transposase